MRASDIKAVHNLPKNSYLNYIRLFPITQTPKAKSYFTIILTLVSVLGFSLFAISPTINTIIELKRKLADSRFVNDALEQKITALDSLQNQYSTMGETLTRISTAVPTTPEVPQLFARIQTLTNDTGVEIIKLESQEVELTKSTKEAQPSSFVFLLTIQGTYQQTISFINALGSFNRVLTLDTVSIERDPLGEKPLQTTIRARAYFHPEVL